MHNPPPPPRSQRCHDAEHAGRQQQRENTAPTRTPADTTTKRRRPHSAASAKNSSSLTSEAVGAAPVRCGRRNRAQHQRRPRADTGKRVDGRHRHPPWERGGGGARVARRKYGRQQVQSDRASAAGTRKPCRHAFLVTIRQHGKPPTGTRKTAFGHIMCQALPPLHARHTLLPHHTTPVASCPRQHPHSTQPPQPPPAPRQKRRPSRPNALLGLDRLSRRLGGVCRLGGRRGHHPARPPDGPHRRSGPRLPAQGLADAAASAGTHRGNGEEGRCHDAWQRGGGQRSE